MKRKNDELEKICVYCEYGTAAPPDGSGEERVVCMKKGIVSAFHSCRKFKYDLLKREPKREARLPELERIDID